MFQHQFICQYFHSALHSCCCQGYKKAWVCFSQLILHVLDDPFRLTIISIPLPLMQKMVYTPADLLHKLRQPRYPITDMFTDHHKKHSNKNKYPHTMTGKYSLSEHHVLFLGFVGLQSYHKAKYKSMSNAPIV